MSGLSLHISSLLSTGSNVLPTPYAGNLLLSGDMQAGTDRLLLSGDMQSGTDVLVLSGNE